MNPRRLSVRSLGIVRRFVATVVLLLVCAGSSPADTESAAPESRTVVAFYDSAGESFFLDVHNPVHQHLTLPLNHLGMRVLEYDIRGDAPPDDVLDDARAVLAYLRSTEQPSPWLRPWLERNLDSERHRFVLVGDPGALLLTPEGEHDGGAWLGERLAGFGLGYDAAAVDLPIGLSVDLSDAARSRFEKDATPRAGHRGPWNESSANDVWVRTRHRAGFGHTRAPVVTGSWGGIALDPWFLDLGTPVAEHTDSRWSLDPFEFFRVALGLEGVPAPDPCVAFGRRAFFFHVDGDGFEGFSTVATGQRCGQVLLDHVVDRYELPMSLSVIIASLADELEPAEPTDRMRIAAEIFARANVEPASHTVLHPFSWQSDAYPAGIYERTRAFDGIDGYEYSEANEVTESLAFIDRYLMPDGRECDLVFWSGDCTPSIDALRAVSRAGAISLNGGEYRLDRLQPSVSRVRGLVRHVGDELQVYCGAPNENVYAEFFGRMPTAFGHVDETLENTGTPRILKPADVYAHFYSAASAPRLDALHTLLLRWGVRGETNRMFASDYVRAARAAFTTARVTRTAEGWSLTGFGDCRTIRFDDEARLPDLSRSTGIVGWRRIRDALYVHVGAPEAVLVLADSPPAYPHVRAADHLLEEVELAPERVSFRSRAHSPRWVSLAGLPADTDVAVRLGAEWSYDARTDADGRLEVALPGAGNDRVEVVLR